MERISDYLRLSSAWEGGRRVGAVYKLPQGECVGSQRFGRGPIPLSACCLETHGLYHAPGAAQTGARSALADDADVSGNKHPCTSRS